MLTLKHGNTNQSQPVRGSVPDVLHDVSVDHPLRHRRKLILLDATQDAEKLQNIRVG